MTEPYAPLNTLKPVADNIWIVDGPSIRFYGTPFSTRMTVVRLENGDIWLHSPTRICDSLRDEVTALGPVCHLITPISPNGKRHFSRPAPMPPPAW